MPPAGKLTPGRSIAPEQIKSNGRRHPKKQKERTVRRLFFLLALTPGGFTPPGPVKSYGRSAAARREAQNKRHPEGCLLFWRRHPDSNWGWRFCRALFCVPYPLCRSYHRGSVLFLHHLYTIFVQSVHSTPMFFIFYTIILFPEFSSTHFFTLSFGK